MTTLRPLPLLLLLAGLIALAQPAPLQAHGATYEAVEAEAFAVRFVYLLGDAMAGAEVRVYGPEEQRLHQRGRTDAGGRFAFVPDRPGEWTLESDDGAGHSVRALVTVGGDASGVVAPDSVAIPATLLIVLLIVSALLNAGLVSALLAARRRGSKGSS